MMKTFTSNFFFTGTSLHVNARLFPEVIFIVSGEKKIILCCSSLKENIRKDFNFGLLLSQNLIIKTKSVQQIMWKSHGKIHVVILVFE